MSELLRSCVRVKIYGRVQGVRYRAWVEREARARGLDGWVRNRRDGSVEAIFAGAEDEVDEMIEICRLGPPAAKVMDINRSPTEFRDFGFSILATL